MNRTKFWERLGYVGVALAGAVVGGAVGGAIVAFTDGEIRGEEKFDVFAQLVLVFLAFFGAVGVGAYYVLSTRVKEEVKREEEFTRLVDLMRRRMSIGYAYWMSYEKFDKFAKLIRCGENPINKFAALIGRALSENPTREKELDCSGFLNEAINETRAAVYGDADKLATKFSERYDEIEEHIYDGKNNLAYYLAVRGTPTDLKTAKELVEDIETKIAKYISNEQNWRDTIDTVRRKCRDAGIQA